MAPRFQPIVDRLLAEQHGISVDALHEPGVRVVAGPPGYDRINVFRLDATVLVMRPDDVVPFGEALGPSQHAYLHRDDLDRSLALGAARRVEWTDAVAELRDAVGLDAFHEGGFGTTEIPEVSWALHGERGRILALGNMTDFAGTPTDVGLVTHPDHRGKGLAAALAADMLVAAFEHHEVARYRALKTNRASLAVALRLGFTPYGENVVIRPAS
jgi:RimJ/RimL family protein N-acetyltransferase